MIIWTVFTCFISIAFADAKCASQCGCRRTACASPPAPPVVPIMLDNCGPNPRPLPPINAPPVQTPLVNKPPVALPANVPPLKTIANTCHCVKTVVKPQVVQQLITVPSIQRYIQTTHTPVVEHIQYHGVPINCPPYAPEPAESTPPCAPPPCLPVAPPAAPPAPPAAPALPPSALMSALLAALSAAVPTAPPPPPLPPALPALPALPAPPALPAFCLQLPASLSAPAPPPPCPASLQLNPYLLSLLAKLC